MAACKNYVTPVAFTDDDLPDMLHNGLTANCKAMGMLDEIRDPILLFNTFRFDGRREERTDWLQSQFTAAPKGGLAGPLLGYGAFNWFHRDLTSPVICRRCWRIHFQRGYLHRCHYCGFGELLTTS